MCIYDLFDSLQHVCRILGLDPIKHVFWCVLANAGFAYFENYDIRPLSKYKLFVST